MAALLAVHVVTLAEHLQVGADHLPGLDSGAPALNACRRCRCHCLAVHFALQVRVRQWLPSAMITVALVVLLSRNLSW